MTGYGFTIADITAIAAECGLRIKGDDMPGLARQSYGDNPHSRARCSFVLALDTSTRREDGTLPFQRVSMLARYGTDKHRRIAAVCWHGHRDVMRKLFDRFPHARIKTALADYRGAEDFATKYQDTAGEGNGYNLSYGQACVCAETDAEAARW